MAGGSAAGARTLGPMLIEGEGGEYLGAGWPKERAGSECNAPGVDVIAGGDPTTLRPMLLCDSLAAKPDDPDSLTKGAPTGRFNGVVPAFPLLIIIAPCGLELRLLA